MSDPAAQLARMQLDRSHPKQSYKFWETQPVSQFEAQPADAKEGPIHEKKSPEDARQEPYPLTDQFEWCLCDLQDEAVISEVFDLLRLNYVEDEDQMFRFCYSKDFLRWALCPPGHKKEWHLGVRVISNKKLVCFSCAVPLDDPANDFEPFHLLKIACLYRSASLLVSQQPCM